MPKENSRVKTLICKEDYKAGSIGVIVSIYNVQPVYEVEIWDEDSYPIDAITYLFAELEPD